MWPKFGTWKGLGRAFEELQLVISRQLDYHHGDEPLSNFHAHPFTMLCARWLQPLQPWYVVCLYHFISIHRLWVWDGRWLKTTRKTGILENRMPGSQDYGFCIFPKLGGVVLSLAPWWKHAVWGVVIPPSLGNRYNGSINPYQCGDDHPPILVYNPTLTIVGYIYNHQYVYI